MQNDFQVTQITAIPLIVVMVVANWTTKVSLFVHDGFWKTAHEARPDFAMLLGSLFLLAVGTGHWSIDARISRTDRC